MGPLGGRRIFVLGSSYRVSLLSWDEFCPPAATFALLICTKASSDADILILGFRASRTMRINCHPGKRPRLGYL